MMVLARNLLRYHGIPVPPAGLRRVIHDKPALPIGRGWPAEVLSRHTNWFLDEANNDIGLAMLLAAEAIAKTNQTLFFEGMVQSFQGTGETGDDWATLKEVLPKLDMFAVIGTRANMLDEVICQINDCFQTSCGFPVDQNGQESDLCFDRRGAPRNSISKLRLTKENRPANVPSFNKIYRVKLYADHLIDQIETEYRLVDVARKNLESIGLSPEKVPEEDLHGFQPPVYGAIDKAVTALSILHE
jgi:hypothetical protein